VGLYAQDGRLSNDEAHRIAFPAPSEWIRIAGLAPNPELEETVTTGCLLYTGRYVRPPYIVRLKDHVLSVNGNVLWSGNWHYSDTMISSFNSTVKGLREGRTRIHTNSESGWGFSERSLASMPQERILAGLKAIDRVMKSDLSKEKKTQELLALPVWFGPGHYMDAKAVLSHWDGID
jgi:hypothetical protein